MVRELAFANLKRAAEAAAWPPPPAVPGFGMRTFCRSVWAIAFGLLVWMAATANAQSLPAAVSGFAADSYSEVEDAINAVAASGDPRALEIIQALQEGRLLFDPTSTQVFIKDQDRLVEAATGHPAVAVNEADLKPVRLNNRLRRAVEAALGAYTVANITGFEKKRILRPQ